MKERFEPLRPILSAVLVGAIAAILIAFVSPVPRSVEAQNTGTVQLATRVQSFSFATTTASQVINIGAVSQVGHLLTYNWSDGPTTLCHFVFEGSSDNSTWFVLASGVQAGSATAVPQSLVYANGYFPYLRVLLNPEGFSTCETGPFTLTYAGFATAIPINNTAQSFDVTADLNGTTAIGPPSITNLPTGPFIWDGFQCANSGGAAAFIQLFNASVAPTLGTTTPFYTAMVPASGNFSYAGQPLSQLAHGVYMWIAATTTRTGGTTASGVSCMVQVNYTGPFYPLTVVQ